MKVFLDTNVILDFLMKREPFFEDAKTIMALGYNKCYDLYIYIFFSLYPYPHCLRLKP